MSCAELFAICCSKRDNSWSSTAAGGAHDCRPCCCCCWFCCCFSPSFTSAQRMLEHCRGPMRGSSASMACTTCDIKIACDLMPVPRLLSVTLPAESTLLWLHALLLAVTVPSRGCLSATPSSWSCALAAGVGDAACGGCCCASCAE